MCIRDSDDIITFAENLCGVSFDKKYIIRAEREPYVPNATIKKYPNELYENLADSENFVWQVLNDYGFNVDKATDEKELLYDFLLTSDLYHTLRLRLGGICELSEIGEKLSVNMDGAIAVSYTHLEFFILAVIFMARGSVNGQLS